MKVFVPDLWEKYMSNREARRDRHRYVVMECPPSRAEMSAERRRFEVTSFF